MQVFAPHPFRYLIITLACATASASCNKYIDVPPPRNSITAAQIFDNSLNATEAMMGVYISIMDNKSMLNAGLTVYTGLGSDELYRPSSFESEDAFSANALTDMNPICVSLYATAYNWIYQWNLIIDQAPRAAGIDDSTKSRLYGEALFLRSLTYFYLINLYGDMPLVISPDFHATALLPRSPVQTIYDRIVSDLRTADSCLPAAYTASGEYQNDRTRPNRAAAKALLSRVYCYRGEWALAEQYAGQAIDDPAYRLEENLNDVFLSGSAEAIWQLQPVRSGLNTTEGNLLIPRAGAPPVYALTDWLIKSFETGDLRYSSWTAAGAPGGRLLYPFKYKLAADKPAGAEYYMMLRLAEQYLIRAEARARSGNRAGALSDLNIIRQRAGLKGCADSGASLLHAIWHERQVEFFAECGHRWLDLKRTGQIDSVLGAEKTGWQPYQALYPIPYTQLESNPNLVQNKGY